MNAKIKVIIIAATLLLALSLGASAELTSSFSTGNGGKTAGISEVYSKDSGDALNEINIAVPIETGITTAVTGTGSLPEQRRSLRDSRAGIYAEAYAKVDGTPSTTWSYQWYLAWNPGNWVNAREWLSAENANFIKAYGYAANSRGEDVLANVEVTTGSLRNYYTTATADPTSAGAYQEASYAGGDKVRLDVLGRNYEGDLAQSYTSITKGNVNTPLSSPLLGYSATAGATNTYARTQVNSLRASAPTGSIYQTLYAKKVVTSTFNDVSQVVASINNGNLYSYPYSSTYTSFATANRYFGTTAAQQSAYMNGASAYGQSYASKYGMTPIQSALTKSSADLKVANVASTTSSQRSATSGYLS